MEMPPDASTFRKPAPRMVRLIRAYLDGYRPRDWPKQKPRDWPSRYEDINASTADIYNAPILPRTSGRAK